MLCEILLWLVFFGLVVKFGWMLCFLLLMMLVDKLLFELVGQDWVWLMFVGYFWCMLVLVGCVQLVLVLNINVVMVCLLDCLGIELFEEVKVGCCGVLCFYFNDQVVGCDDMWCNIDVWWLYVEVGIEVIVVIVLGCGVQIKDYGYVLVDDVVYVEKVVKISVLFCDLLEILVIECVVVFGLLDKVGGQCGKFVFYFFCMLQYGLKICGIIEEFLWVVGYVLILVVDVYLCCGLVGIYLVFQFELLVCLCYNKLVVLNVGLLQVIVIVNIGCLMYLQVGSLLLVWYWIELIDEVLV